MFCVYSCFMFLQNDDFIWTYFYAHIFLILSSWLYDVVALGVAFGLAYEISYEFF